jgi:hypothetical protein
MVFIKLINAEQLKLRCFSKFKFQFNTYFEEKITRNKTIKNLTRLIFPKLTKKNLI